MAKIKKKSNDWRGGKRPGAGRKAGSVNKITALEQAAPEIKESKKSKNQVGNQTARGGARPGAGRKKKQTIGPPEPASPAEALLSNLDARQRKYLAARMAGKPKQAAAIEAGYAPSTARAAKNIETPSVRKAFEALIQETIPGPKIAERLAEGLDAQETKFFQKDGRVVETRDVVAFGERREYLKLAAEYGGYHVPKAEVTPDGPIQVVIRRIGVAEGEYKPPPVNVAMQVNLAAANSRVEPKPVVVDDAPIEGDVPLDVTYNAGTQVLRVNYQSGATFEHPRVPGDVYGLLRTAPDKGKFFANIIRKGFPGQRVKV